MNVPRHIRFVASVSSPGHGFSYRFGERREVGVDISVPWAMRFLGEGKAVAASDARYVPTARQVGGGMYELPDGSRVRGKEAAEEELQALVERGFEPADEAEAEGEGEAEAEE